MRRIKQNIWGNWAGYVGRNRVHQFGTEDMAAAYWLLTGVIDYLEPYSDEWELKCRAALAA